MKKILITISAVLATVSFFSFTSNNQSLSAEKTYSGNEGFVNDTVPRKKDSSRKKSGTVPYDSFGKPKKMDTTRLQ